MTNHTQQITVLLADDHQVVRAGIRQFLEQDPEIEVIAEADDGEMAKTLIQQLHPQVVVLDIQMPKTNGIEVTQWVRKNHRETGILVLTAYDDDPYVMAVLQAGANGYVLKTAAPEEIIRAIHSVYEGKSVLDPEITHKVMSHLFTSQTMRTIEKLTLREMDVLKLTARGYTNKGIGAQLHISDRTVQGHLAHIFEKLQASSRTEAVMRAVSLGLLPKDLGEFESDA